MRTIITSITSIVLLLAVCGGALAQDDFVTAYRAAAAHSRGFGFKVGFTQMTVVVVEEDSVTATLAGGRNPNTYAIPIAKARNAGQVVRSVCPTAQLRLGNFPIVLTGIFPVRYERGYDKVPLINQGGFATADVPLRGGQAALVLPNNALLSVENPILRIAILDGQGKQVPIRFLPVENTTGMMTSVPHNQRLGWVNDLHNAVPYGGVTFAVVVPKGACGRPS